MDINNDIKSNNKKNITLVIVVILITMAVIGGTYAYMTLGISITNNTIAYNTTCFDIVYDADNDSDDGTPITGTLVPSSGPIGGLNGKVSIGLDENCTNIDAYGNFILNVDNASDILFQTVDAHCENSNTLRTLTKYTDESSCESAGGEWVTNGTAFKYAIYATDNIDSTTVPIISGYLSSNSNSILYENIAISNEMVDYYVYIWLDGNLSDNSYASQSFFGNISVSVLQIPYDAGAAYAIYSETDNSLRIFSLHNLVNNTDDEVIASPMGYKFLEDENTISEDEEYFELESTIFTSLESVPWHEYRNDITSIYIENEISPVSLRYWFQDMPNVTYMDLAKLNTSRVTNMIRTFNNTGYNVTSFKIVGLSNWDVSNAINMGSMFEGTGHQAIMFDIGDLSNWDVSSVTSMSNMFYEAGYQSTMFDIGDLSNWDVSSVTNTGYMFFSAGYQATSFNIGDLTNWDVSSVTKMNSMFANAGKNATSFNIGDLNNWDVSSVTTMYAMFSNAGYNSKLFNIGNLSNWDVSSVINMGYMFNNAGYQAMSFNIGDLNNWDVSNVTNMDLMFATCAYTSTTFNIGDISGWNTSNVITMNYMFSRTGYKANNWSLNLSGWNVNKVTEYTDFNVAVTSKITAPTWVN